MDLQEDEEGGSMGELLRARDDVVNWNPGMTSLSKKELGLYDCSKDITSDEQHHQVAPAGGEVLISSPGE